MLYLRYKEGQDKNDRSFIDGELSYVGSVLLVGLVLIIV